MQRGDFKRGSKGARQRSAGIEWGESRVLSYILLPIYIISTC
jgi:hypothetical protein